MGYRIGEKKKKGKIKITILIVAAFVFWYRFHYCHHPYINPIDDNKNGQNVEQPMDDAEK